MGLLFVEIFKYNYVMEDVFSRFFKKERKFIKKILIIVFSLFLISSPMVLKAEVKSLNLEEALKNEGIEPAFDKLIEDEKQVNVTFFRKKGEEKSVEFLKFLNEKYEEYGALFNLVSYEVSENEDNRELMNNVFDYLSAQVNDVPFITIGGAYFITYDESINENLISTIFSYYDSQDKTDKVEEVLVKYYRNENLIIGVTIGGIALLIVLLVYASKKGK